MRNQNLAILALFLTVFLFLFPLVVPMENELVSLCLRIGLITSASVTVALAVRHFFLPPVSDVGRISNTPRKLKGKALKEFEFKKLSTDIYATMRLLGKDIGRTRTNVSPKTKSKVEATHAHLRRFGIKTPEIPLEVPNYEVFNRVYFEEMYEYSRSGLLREARKASKLAIGKYKETMLKLENENT